FEGVLHDIAILCARDSGPLAFFQRRRRVQACTWIDGDAGLFDWCEQFLDVRGADGALTAGAEAKASDRRELCCQLVTARLELVSGIIIPGSAVAALNG